MSSDYTQQQSPFDEQRSKDLSLQRTRPPIEVSGYQSQRFLGAGAYGEVWAGQDRNTGRRVAIKFYAHRRGVDWSLLSREVEKLVFLSADRYVVQLLEVGWDADPPYYVMEYVENGSLEDLLRKEGTFTAAAGTEMFREIAIGLGHAHGRGVLHCDLKPANILLDQDHRPRLADFGQSRLSHEQRPALGTLFYMAPEQADLEAVPDVRWDVYALGAIFYCLLVGYPPHRDDEAVSQIETAADLPDRLARYRKLIQTAPLPTGHRRVVGMDRRLAEVIDRCLEPNPDRRFANVQEVLDALAARERARAQARMMTLGLVGPLLVLLVTGLFSWRGYQSALSDTEAGYRQYAVQNNQFAAQLAAEKVTGEIGKYFNIVGFEASQPELRDVLFPTLQSQPLQTLIDPQATDAELIAARNDFLQDPVRSKLSQYLEDRLHIYRQSVKQDHHAPKFASVFVTDRFGTQLAAAFDEEVVSQSVATNVAHRSYFTGLPEDLPRFKRVPEDTTRLKHLQQTRLSAVFQSSSTKKWKVAVATPLYRGEGSEEFAGVLVFTINLGDFAVFREEGEVQRNSFAVLIDGRGEEGTILQHPLLDEVARKVKDHQIQLDDKTRDQLYANRVAKRVLDPATNELYHDPLGDHVLGREYDRRWIAAVSPVRAPTVPGTHFDAAAADTGLDVLVQTDYQSVVAPVHELSERLLRNLLWMVAVMVLAGIAVWALALRLFREPGSNSQLVLQGPRQSTSLHGMETLPAPLRRPPGEPGGD